MYANNSSIFHFNLQDPYSEHVSELGGLFQLLGVTKDEQEVRQIIKTFDDDASGEIGITEFIILMIKQVISSWTGEKYHK